MIDAIIQIPQRLHTGTIVSCGRFVDAYGTNGEELRVLSGRSARIVPLIFYKICSNWGSIRYEHIFATDEAFDTLSMSQFKRGEDGTYSKNPIGPILYPISMKRILNWHTETFLFAKSIDFLLNNYQLGKSLSLVPFSGTSCIDLQKSIEVPTGAGINALSRGVSSYGAYRKFIFEDLLYSRYGSTKLNPELELAQESMTIERPARIFSCMEDILQTCNRTEEVWNRIDEMYTYETGRPIDVQEFFEEHSYTFDKNNIPSSLDPITLMCIMSPTFITGNNIKPYLSTNAVTRSYSTVGLTPEDDTFTRLIVPFQFNGLDTYSRYELMECIMSIPDDWCSIRMTWDSCVPEYQSMFGYSYSASTEYLYEVCKHIFLNHWVDNGLSYDNIVLSKNWYDEIFISCVNKYKTITYYISLPWFHLTSPSLINKQLFFK